MNDPDPFNPNLRRIGPADLFILPEQRPPSPHGLPSSSASSTVAPTEACADCGGSGWLSPGPTLGRADHANLVRCSCGTAEKQNAPSALARLGDELGDYAACTFDAFDTDRPLEPIYLLGSRYVAARHYEQLTPAQQGRARPLAETNQAALLTSGAQACRDYAADPRGWLCLHGAYGSGKSHLAAAVAHVLAARGWSVRYRSSPGLLDALKAGFKDGTSDVIFADVLSCQLLILDDLGAEHLSGWARERFFRLLNERQRLPTVITSNLHPDDLAPPDDVDTGRLISRIIGNARCVWLPISDYRRAKAGAP